MTPTNERISTCENIREIGDMEIVIPRYDYVLKGEYHKIQFFQGFLKEHKPEES